MRFTVYRQDPPQAIAWDADGQARLFKARLVEVGEANSMQEAKQFCVAPVLERIEEPADAN